MSYTCISFLNTSESYLALFNILMMCNIYRISRQSFLISVWLKMGRVMIKVMFLLESWVPMDMLLLNILPPVKVPLVSLLHNVGSGESRLGPN